jgi:uncharacterized repeat protein (TIGR03843 family)
VTVLSEDRLLDLLTNGQIRLLGLLAGASNHTFLVEVADGGPSIQAVYKPARGEQPLWDFPRGTLHRREVAAYRLSRALGWPSVPATVLRDGPAGPGALQAFVDADPREHFLSLQDSRLADFQPVAAFDVLLNNADRKSGHCLLGKDGRIWNIDHGLCFGTQNPMRTVIWQFAGTPVPKELLAGAQRIAGELRSGILRREMAELLSDEEIDATVERAEGLVKSGLFPHPGPGRAVPWPLV